MTSDLVRDEARLILVLLKDAIAEHLGSHLAHGFLGERWEEC